MATERTRVYGARLIWIAGSLGAAVSLFNYFSPDSGIGDTAGALLVVASSVLVVIFGLIIGMDRFRRRRSHVIHSRRVFDCAAGNCFRGLSARVDRSASIDDRRSARLGCVPAAAEACGDACCWFCCCR